MFRDGLRINGIDCRTGAFTSGQSLVFNGSAIVGGSGGGANFGTSTIDFGSDFTDSGSVVVTGQTWVTSGSHIRAWVQDDSTADSSASEHEFLAASSTFVITDRVVGVGFTIHAYPDPGFAQGDFTVHWEGS
jgi:hypothetical protein